MAASSLLEARQVERREARQAASPWKQRAGSSSLRAAREARK